MLFFPNCKINIGLNILRRRSDGYHDIETLFCPVELSDILEFVPLPNSSYGDIRLSLTGLPVDCRPDQNLCVKAYELLHEDFNLPSVDAHLHKVVPSGAGLGGGSSDAAFMMKMLAKRYIPDMSTDILCEYASRLGSDCTFFIKNQPMLGQGRGNILREIREFPGNLEVIIVHPRIHISTAEAYAAVNPVVPEERLENLISLPVEKWKDRIINDFEKSVFKKYPVIKEIKLKMYNLGAVYASMSGSGSAVYGLFKNETPLPDDQFPGMFVWTGTVMQRRD